MSPQDSDTGGGPIGSIVSDIEEMTRSNAAAISTIQKKTDDLEKKILLQAEQANKSIEKAKKDFQEFIRQSERDVRKFIRQSEKHENFMLWLVGAIAVIFLLSFAAIVIDYHHNTLIEEERNYDLLKQNTDSQKNDPSVPNYKKLEIDF